MSYVRIALFAHYFLIDFLESDELLESAKLLQIINVV